MSGKESNAEDLHCMRRLAQGEDLALNELMARWKNPLISFCRRYTGNDADAREIAQETFVRVYQNRRKYRPQGAFSSWLFQIAANLCRMRARWQRRHPEVSQDDLGDDFAHPDADEADPGELADRRRLAADLDQALRELPHDLRVAFILKELEGQSYREIAAGQKCSEKAVERRLARARELLRKKLEPLWAEETRSAPIFSGG